MKFSIILAIAALGSFCPLAMAADAPPIDPIPPPNGQGAAPAAPANPAPSPPADPSPPPKATRDDKKKPAAKPKPVPNPADVLASLIAHYRHKQETEPHKVRYANAIDSLQEAVRYLDNDD